MTIASWPFRDAIVAVSKLHRDDFSMMEGSSAKELVILETVMKACSVFISSLRKADPEGWKSVTQDIRENKLL